MIQFLLVVLVLFIHLLSVFGKDGVLGIAELSCILLLLLLKGLVTCSIFKHPLRILITTSFEFMMVLFSRKPELLLELIFDLVLAGLELLNLATNHQLLARNLLQKLLTFILKVICTGSLIDSIGIAGVRGVLQLSEKTFPRGADLLHDCFLGQDLVTVGIGTLTDTSSLAYASDNSMRVTIFDFMHHKATICAGCKKPVVIVAEAHALDWAAMSLHFA